MLCNPFSVCLIVSILLCSLAVAEQPQPAVYVLPALCVWHRPNSLKSKQQNLACECALLTSSTSYTVTPK